MGPKNIPSCFIPCILFVFTQELEILVTSLILPKALLQDVTVNSLDGV